MIFDIFLLDGIEDFGQENEPSFVGEVNDKVICFLSNLGMLSFLSLCRCVLKEFYEAVMQKCQGLICSRWKVLTTSSLLVPSKDLGELSYVLIHVSVRVLDTLNLFSEI